MHLRRLFVWSLLLLTTAPDGLAQLPWAYEFVVRGLPGNADPEQKSKRIRQFWRNHNRIRGDSLGYTQHLFDWQLPSVFDHAEFDDSTRLGYERVRVVEKPRHKTKADTIIEQPELPFVPRHAWHFGLRFGTNHSYWYTGRNTFGQYNYGYTRPFWDYTPPALSAFLGRRQWRSASRFWDINFNYHWEVLPISARTDFMQSYELEFAYGTGANTNWQFAVGAGWAANGLIRSIRNRIRPNPWADEWVSANGPRLSLAIRSEVPLGAKTALQFSIHSTHLYLPVENRVFTYLNDGGLPNLDPPGTRRMFSNIGASVGLRFGKTMQHRHWFKLPANP